MMKFMCVLGVGLFSGLFSELMFWMVGGLIVASCLLVTRSGSFFVDSIYLSGGMSMDQISFSLLSLSLFITFLMLFSSSGVFSSKSVLYFYGFVYLLMCVLTLTFVMSNLLTFYFFFEVTLIPSLLIIMGWGYQPERLQAGVYFLFYTLGASLPLLLVMVFYVKVLGGLDMGCGMGVEKPLSFSGGLFFFGVLAFMVKMPMFFSHLWLPSAHVEAPVSGSMILAGVLLKLGGYGIYRIFNLLGASVGAYGAYFWGLSLLGMVYVGLMCCRLNDMSGLVAYSSVAHMGMVICGLVSYSAWGFSGALMMMVAHGVCSSGLFCAVNIYYERSGSRGFFINKGLLSVAPSFTLLFFMLCGSNMAMPPTMNLLSEIFLMGSIINFDYIMLVGFPLGSFLGATFTLFLFSYSQHGKNYEGGSFYSKMKLREFHLMLVHILPLNLLVLKPEFFFSLF